MQNSQRFPVLDPKNSEYPRFCNFGYIWQQPWVVLMGTAHLHYDADDDSPTFLSVFVGAKAVVNIYHDKCEPEDFVPGWVLVAMGSTQLDEYYEALVDAGRVDVVEKIEDKPWGYRQFAIKDGDGNKLTFFRFLEGGNPGED